MQPTQAKPNIEYPSTDGQPMAQNTKQYRWITTIQGGLAAMFRDNPDVFVAGDLFWYPIEGNNQLCAAPDVMVVFGRPKGDRDSYRQWEEGGVAPQVVFEIASSSNTASEWVNKTLFYERFGVQEFYIYDPEKNTLEGYIRGADGHLQPVEQIHGWVSPLLKIKFELQDDGLVITAPDGSRFQTYEELAAAFDRARQQLEQERQLREQERLRAERLARKLRELGVEPD